jgi:hypothetical protein
MTAGTVEALVMSRVQSFFRAISAVLAATVAGALLASPAGAATPAKPRLPEHKARVAQGVRVDLAAPALSAAELAAKRPEFARLKPRARTNAE